MPNSTLRVFALRKKRAEKGQLRTEFYLTAVERVRVALFIKKIRETALWNRQEEA